MNYLNRQTATAVLWGGFVFLMGLCFFSVIEKLPYIIDMQIHNLIVQKIMNGEFVMPPHFFYFVLIILLSGITSIANASIIVLSAALALKFFATRQIIQKFYHQIGFTDIKFLNSGIFLLCFSLLFLTNLPNKLFGNNDIPPISWHNSTVVMIMPFSIWLFWYSYLFLKNNNWRTLLIIIVVGILSVLIKPSFVLVFIIVFPFFLLYKYKLSSVTFKASAIIVLFIIALGAQYFYTYKYLSGNPLLKEYNNIKIVISPFNAWHQISGNIFFSFLGWALYPLLFLLVYFKQATRSLFYNYSFFLYVTGMLIFILLSEKTLEGQNISAVNFLWQAIVCHYIWFVVSLIVHVKILSEKKSFSFKDIVLILVCCAFILSGMLYAFRTIIYPGFSN